MKNNYNCLIVDDERAMCETLAFHLQDKNYNIFIADNAINAINIFNSNKIDIVITDVKMRGLNGLELLKKIKEINNDVPVIVITGYATIDLAVEALKNGAYDFISKPFQIEKLLITLENAIEQYKLKFENQNLKKEINSKIKFYDPLIGESKAIVELKKLIDDVAKTNSSVLISGESGTGKEIIAREIYQKSNRNNKPFYALNCTALPTNLVESELFGYNKGAFTGANESKKGILEIVNDGTLFLDEIGDLSIEIQAKLLRVLENKEFYKIGGVEKISVDFRLIAATNKNLKQLVKEKIFRDDLYYRINTVELHIPPLRERKDDIKLFINYFLNKFAIELKKPVPVLSKEVEKKLLSYSYPGNVRELKNIIERIMIFNKDKVIKNIDFLNPDSEDVQDLLDDNNQILPLKEFEKKYIYKIYNKLNKNKSQTAKALKITRKTLDSKLKSLL
ncbi:MAG TPA: sigma-54 dependent transcriptional regulator [bacterium]|nr:sigma-54 dependent transcriptional regulator [bacterium]HOL48554.1 sigma-54 dependent transcriptional regulator [bacterium]HPQ18021.1 sigma-54 dependent transcriptional regulator [bacterium]